MQRSIAGCWQHEHAPLSRRGPQVQATLRMQYIQEFYQVRACWWRATLLLLLLFAARPACACTPQCSSCPALAVQTVRDHCFKLCVTSPGSSLSSSEQKCLGRCMDRYQDVSARVLQRRPGSAPAAAQCAARAARALQRVQQHGLAAAVTAAAAATPSVQATTVVTKAVLGMQGMQ